VCVYVCVCLCVSGNITVLSYTHIHTHTHNSSVADGIPYACVHVSGLGVCACEWVGPVCM